MEDVVKSVEILGESYKLIESSAQRFDKFEADGFCEWWAKEIHIKSDIGCECEDTMFNLKDYRNGVITHEVVHAFLFASGMKDYELDEVLVEWIARNLNRLHRVSEQAVSLLKTQKKC